MIEQFQPQKLNQVLYSKCKEVLSRAELNNLINAESMYLSYQEKIIEIKVLEKGFLIKVDNCYEAKITLNENKDSNFNFNECKSEIEYSKDELISMLKLEL